MTKRERATPTDPLVVALESLVGAASLSIASLTDPIVLFQGLEEWYKDASDSVVFRRRTPTHPTLTGSARAAIEATPEWTDAIAALRADPVLGGLVDRTVGTALGASLVQSDGLLFSVIERVAMSGEPGAEIPVAVDHWRESIGADPVAIITVIVIAGIQPTEEVKLSDSVALRRMTDEEVASALRLDLLPTVGPSGPIAFVHERSCLTVRQALPRTVEPAPTELDDAMAAFQSRDQQVEASIAALRLLGFRAVRELARMTTDGRGGTHFARRASGAVGPPAKSIDRSQEAHLRHLFAAVETANANQTQLAIALRRYSGSHEPRHEEDRLLDLWIAVEALFSPPGATEVTVQVAMNIANSVDVAGVSRRGVFDWVKRAYRLRSELVHGRSPTLGKVGRLHGGRSQAISEVADDVAELVGLALNEFLFESGLPDFTRLALRLDPETQD